MTPRSSQAGAVWEVVTSDLSRAYSRSILGEVQIDHTALTRRGYSGCAKPIWNPYNHTYVRCRTCRSCANYKRWHWIQRAKIERSKWLKCWFVTLTFRNAATASYAAVQRYLKRTRKGSKGPLAYLATEEYGSRQGRYHVHLLVFSNTATWRELSGKWVDGFVHARLARGEGAFSYVAKYIAKQSGRVRASVRFGKVGVPDPSVQGEGTGATAVPPFLECAAHFSQSDEGDDDATNATTSGTTAARLHVFDASNRFSSPTDAINLMRLGRQPICDGLLLWRRGRSSTRS